jgi:hypothetical protein
VSAAGAHVRFNFSWTRRSTAYDIEKLYDFSFFVWFIELSVVY